MHSEMLDRVTECCTGLFPLPYPSPTAIRAPSTRPSKPRSYLRTFQSQNILGTKPAPRKVRFTLKKNAFPKKVEECQQANGHLEIIFDCLF